MIDRARANEKIEFVTPFAIDEILAPQGFVEGVRLRNSESKETREVPLHGVFVAIGHDPNTTVFKGKLEMDSNGYLLAKHGSLTSSLACLLPVTCRTIAIARRSRPR